MRTILDYPNETFRQLKAQPALNGVKLKESFTHPVDAAWNSNR
jgi:hypothetical protein